MASVAETSAQAPAVQQPSTAADAPSSTLPVAKSSTTKPIHSLVLDTGPLIKNEISISTLISQAEVLYTIPSVISEIRDEATRSRLHTTLVPFLTLRSPTPASVKFVVDFARRTGDLDVLSKPDIHLIALTYELECERNGGDGRLRRVPGQKGTNANPLGAPGEGTSSVPKEESQASKEDGVVDAPKDNETPAGVDVANEAKSDSVEQAAADQSGSKDAAIEVTSQVENLSLQETIDPAETSPSSEPTPSEPVPSLAAPQGEEDEASDSDGEGWITPSNLKKHQAKEADPASYKDQQGTLEAALLTSDHAMQNVAMRINLNLVGGTSCTRITRVKTWVLRCHGCFTVTRQTDKQFCPSCGQPTLTRTACSTDSKGTFRVHLKKNYQFNKRGNVYSIPKPVHGTSNGKIAAVSGGGKKGWGKELILAEDQKEYTKQITEDRRTKTRDIMDEDYLPDLLTGRRSGAHGRPRVGAGRNVNSKKRA
ncbi:D-site 20S pre-rRNA nuclease [Coniochaeta ligniaria NRRL 30616]|uniref:20S-pre-rRNA D-site endonuclease NOB1 n=1 Tax=Coniochaeta ligniaria NRRL 30616 TaxID=1408157 RepID=A0A1J7JK38_9PEZI|nr:D-site 20S pre-rRNA nuclease [Coniochaeta ligniaria NRRL 30616]